MEEWNYETHRVHRIWPALGNNDEILPFAGGRHHRSRRSRPAPCRDRPRIWQATLISPIPAGMQTRTSCLPGKRWTGCSSAHAARCTPRYACRVLDMGIAPVFGKARVHQHAPSTRQLRRGGPQARRSKWSFAFPLRLSSITLEMKQHCATAAVLGRLTMVQAVNNVPYGSVYYHSWYRDPAADRRPVPAKGHP